MSKTKIILIAAAFLFVVLLGNYLFAKKYIEPKIVDSAVKKVQDTIDENYNQRIENINTQLRTIDSKLNAIEKKRQDIAKVVAELKRQRTEYKPPANLDEAIKALKERGYEVTIKK